MTKTTKTTKTAKAAAPAAGKVMSKTDMIRVLSDMCGLTKADVKALFDALPTVISQQFRSVGKFVLPGIVQLKVVKKPAVPAGERKNPFTGAMQMMPAKPESLKVKAIVVKACKDLVG